MDTDYLEFQLNSLEMQLMLAGATLSDYDKSQNRVRSANGQWTKSPSAMSDVESLNVFTDKDQKIWKADTPERQKLLSDIAQKLAKGDEKKRREISTALAPALSQLGGDLTGIDIEERKRTISELDGKLSKLLPKKKTNRIISDLILDIDELDYDAKWQGAKDKATVELDKTLSEILNPPPPPPVKKQVKKTFHNIVDEFKAKFKEPTAAEFLKQSADKVNTEKARKEAQAKTSESLKQVGKNTQKLFNDIATTTAVGFEMANQKLENLEETGQRVQKIVGKFYKDNIEAYYEKQSEKGKEQQKIVRKILDEAKAKINNGKTEN